MQDEEEEALWEGPDFKRKREAKAAQKGSKMPKIDPSKGLSQKDLREIQMQGNTQQTMAFARLDPVVYNEKNRARIAQVGKRWTAQLAQASIPIKVFDVEADSLLMGPCAKKKKKKHISIFYIVCFLFSFFLLYMFVVSTPNANMRDTCVKIMNV